MDEMKNVLKKYFGYDNFRKGQDEIISNILKGEDTVAIMPTGAGKSICYQIPAIIMQGTTLVISPLISLMKDQVDSLNQIGIPATYINSSMSASQYMETYKQAMENRFKIIYVAPERLETDSFIQLLNSIKISQIAVDEAHCISQWGHDFRTSYKKIEDIISKLKIRPVVTAFTATATQDVKNDIVALLKLQSPRVFISSFDRENLSFCVENGGNKLKFVQEYVKNNNKESGIIYCSTRKSVDKLYEILQKEGHSVTSYHAGLADKARMQNQEDFIYDKKSIMIATNAFGMGIDKSNIRYVIHYNMPSTMENYYQEAGRAGRDGEKSTCTLLFDRSDVVTNKFLIEQGHSNPEQKKVAYQKLNEMVNYCNTDKCLRKYILEYFGEAVNIDNCNNCSTCNSEIELFDITTETKKILSCIKKMKERFGSGMVVDVLHGSKNAKLKSFGFDTLSTYSIMKEYSKDTLKDIISYLITEGYIEAYGDKYPILRVTPLATDVLFGDETISIKKKIEKNEGKQNKQKVYEDVDEGLFEILREIRKQIAIKNSIPPFIVFGDVSLKMMAQNYPITKEEMLQITGVGEHKFENYGDIFIQAISTYINENNIDVEKSKEILQNKESQKTVKKITEYPDKTTTNKGDTSYVTLNLYRGGYTLEQIASQRSLAVNTIKGHLLNVMELGEEIDLTPFVQTKFKEAIETAIAEHGIGSLRLLKDNLPQEVDYFDIKYYISRQIISK